MTPLGNPSTHLPDRQDIVIHDLQTNAYPPLPLSDHANNIRIASALNEPDPPFRASSHSPISQLLIYSFQPLPFNTIQPF